MLIVEVFSETAETRHYTDGNGEEHPFRVQVVDLHIPGKRRPVEFPRRVPKVKDSKQPENIKAKGWYLLPLSTAFLKWQFQKIEFSLAELEPLTPELAKSLWPLLADYTRQGLIAAGIVQAQQPARAAG